MPWERKIDAGNRALTSGLFSEAYERFNEAIDEGKNFAQGDSSWADAHRGLSKSCLALAKFQEAEAAARIALLSDEGFWGYECAVVAEDLYLVGESLRHQGNFEAAKPLFDRALEFLSQNYGDTHEQSLQILASLVLLHLESNLEFGFQQLHGRAFAAYQASHPTGMWSTFLGLPKLVDLYIESGHPERAKDLLNRELDLLRTTLGRQHREITAVLECQTDLLKRTKRSLAAWQAQAKAYHGANDKVEHEELFFSYECDYTLSASQAFPVIDRLLSHRGLPTSNAPVVLHYSWWHVEKRVTATFQLLSRLQYEDGYESGYASGSKTNAYGPSPTATRVGAEIELEVSLQPQGATCHASYRWRLRNSPKVALAREVMQWMFDEFKQTLEIVPSELDVATAADSAQRLRDAASGRTMKGCVWPSPQGYNEAVQNPATAFGEEQLQRSKPELNVLDLPRPLSGAFATVYRLSSVEGEWAVKCFTERVSDHQMRYQAISTCLQHLSLPFFTPFEYMPTGITVHGERYPIVKMGWVHGQALNVFCASQLGNGHNIDAIARAFLNMVIALEAGGIAHGDLQHGNILVNQGQLLLVDYDGMYVPELQGLESKEIGHRNYQHPDRSAKHFGPYLDNFSAWVIYVSLVAVSRDPRLWELLEAGDECLLFKRDDFVAPGKSKVFRVLHAHADEEVRNLALLFVRLLAVEPQAVPAFQAVLDRSAIRNLQEEV